VVKIRPDPIAPYRDQDSAHDTIHWATAVKGAETVMSDDADTDDYDGGFTTDSWLLELEDGLSERDMAAELDEDATSAKGPLALRSKNFFLFERMGYASCCPLGVA